MSQAMVGRLLGLSRNQVKRIEHEAIQRIRQNLEGTWRQLIN
jgi:DNA-directed RNA polymerase specialized sigma subunit